MARPDSSPKGSRRTSASLLGSRIRGLGLGPLNENDGTGRKGAGMHVRVDTK